MNTIILILLIIMATIAIGSSGLFLVLNAIFKEKRNIENENLQTEQFENEKEGNETEFNLIQTNEKNEEENLDQTIVEQSLVNEKIEKVLQEIIEETNISIEKTQEIKISKNSEVISGIIDEIDNKIEFEKPEIEEEKEIKVEDFKIEKVKPNLKKIVEETIDDEEDEDDSEFIREEGQKLPSKRRSFAIKLSSATESTKRYFSEATNRLRYYGLTARIGKSKVMFRVNKEAYARMFFKGKRIVLALPLDPKDKKYNEEEYKQIDLSKKKGFENLAFGIRLASKKSLELIIDLIDEVVKKFDFKPNEKHKDIDYVEKFPDIYTDFEKEGYGYLLKNTVTKKDAEKFVDEFADKIVKTQIINDKPNNFIKAEISVSDICNIFIDNKRVIDLALLKENNLVSQNANYLIVREGNKIDKPYKVVANEYDPNAVKMICMSGGEATLLKYKED